MKPREFLRVVPSWGGNRFTLRPLALSLSVRSFNTFSGFYTYSDKTLGGNVIKFGMMIYPNDLASADIDAYEYCFYFMRSSVHQIVCELGCWYFGQVEEKVYILACWCIQMTGILSLFMLMGIIVRPLVHSPHFQFSVLMSIIFDLFIRPAVWVWVWVGIGGWLLPSLGDMADMCCHYWQLTHGSF